MIIGNWEATLEGNLDYLGDDTYPRYQVNCLFIWCKGIEEMLARKPFVRQDIRSFHLALQAARLNYLRSRCPESADEDSPAFP